jgi:hypothetical protein
MPEMSPAEREYSLRRAQRRLDRVRERRTGEDDPEEALDDFFVLWRAFESTFDNDSRASIAELARRAMAQAIEFRGAPRCPRLFDCARKLVHEVSRSREDYLRQWFRDHPNEQHENVRDLRRKCEKLDASLRRSSNWRADDSAKLADVLYCMRNAVFHGRLGTSLDTEPRMFAQIRDGMMELVEVRIQWLAAGVSNPDTPRHVAPARR